MEPLEKAALFHRFEGTWDLLDEGFKNQIIAINRSHLGAVFHNQLVL